MKRPSGMASAAWFSLPRDVRNRKRTFWLPKGWKVTTLREYFNVSPLSPFAER